MRKVSVILKGLKREPKLIKQSNAKNGNYTLEDQYLKFLLPFFSIMIIVPLMTRAKAQVITNPSYAALFGSQMVDFFTYYKMAWLLGLTLMSLCLLVPIFLKKKQLLIQKEYDQWLIPLGIFSLIALVSTLLSPYKQFAIWGAYDRSEGLWVLLSYIALCLISYYFMRFPSCFRGLVRSLQAIIGIQFLVGVSQFFGKDILFSNLGKALIVPSILQEMGLNMNLALEQTMVYGTLFHSNYVGSFSAMLFALFIGLAIGSKTNREKGIYGLFALMCFFLLFGSRSRAGLLGAFISVPVFIWLYRASLMKNIKWVMLGVAGVIISVVAMNAASGGVILNKVTSLTFDPRMPVSKINQLEDIQLRDNSASIITTLGVLNVEKDSKETAVFKDNSGNLLKMKETTPGTRVFEDSRYGIYSVQVGKTKTEPAVRILMEGKEIYIGLQGKVHLLNNRHMPIVEEKAVSIGFKGKEDWGSARGYIWSRSIPLLKNTLLIGNGPDTYIMYFPQKDYVSKLKAYNTYNITVDKPHNWYLQMAINTGVLSLLAVLAFIMGYFINVGKAIKLSTLQMQPESISDDVTDMQNAIKAITVAIVAYMGAAFFNDSVVGVAPIFWTLLGSGFGMSVYLQMKCKNAY